MGPPQAEEKADPVVKVTTHEQLSPQHMLTPLTATKFINNMFAGPDVLYIHVINVWVIDLTYSWSLTRLCYFSITVTIATNVTSSPFNITPEIYWDFNTDSWKAQKLIWYAGS